MEKHPSSEKKLLAIKTAKGVLLCISIKKVFQLKMNTQDLLWEVVVWFVFVSQPVQGIR